MTTIYEQAKAIVQQKGASAEDQETRRQVEQARLDDHQLFQLVWSIAQDIHLMPNSVDWWRGDKNKFYIQGVGGDNYLVIQTTGCHLAAPRNYDLYRVEVRNGSVIGYPVVEKAIIDFGQSKYPEERSDDPIRKGVAAGSLEHYVKWERKDGKHVRMVHAQRYTEIPAFEIKLGDNVEALIEEYKLYLVKITAAFMHQEYAEPDPQVAETRIRELEEWDRKNGFTGKTEVEKNWFDKLIDEINKVLK